MTGDRETIQVFLFLFEFVLEYFLGLRVKLEMDNTPRTACGF
jgi:hypothetical protein